MPDERPVDTSYLAATEETVTLIVDGRPVTARPGEMLIAAAERSGTFIPRFCYHPRMKPVGVCRMCLVEVSGPRGATLQPSCYVAVADGMEVTTDSPKVKKAQDGVLEFLLVNHPLDCPVCDKGGECPLQDQTLAYGPGESRFVEEKRHFEKPIPISELVLLDRERCIQCSRCTRFAAEVAGDAQIDFIGRGDLMEVNTFPDLPFTSYFSGNTVQICPVGALTATPYRFSARPWDLEQVESTCTTCSVGCRVAVQSSGNRITRLLGIDSDPVNHSWLCDKGRFAFEASNGTDESRVTEPLIRRSGELVPVSWNEALAATAAGLQKASASGNAESVGLIGGARCTNEGAYAWAKLAKAVLGTDSTDAQLADGLPAEMVLGLPRATIDETCAAKAVVVLSGDLREELPVLFLRLRGAVVDGELPVVELSPQRTALTPYSAATLRYAPGDVAALAASLGAPAGTSADTPAGVDVAALISARAVLARTPEGDGLVVVVGRPSLAEDGRLVAVALRKLVDAYPLARFLPALRRGNVHGALDMGLAPGVLPGRVSLEDGRSWYTDAWGKVPEERGRDTAGILASAAAGDGVEALILLGADPLSDFPDRRLADRALGRADFVVAITASRSASLAHADVVLPAAAAYEQIGTTTNIEGRVQRLGQKLVPPGQAWPDWMIAAELAVALGADLGIAGLTELWDEIEQLAPSHRGLTRDVLESRSAADGVVIPLPVARIGISARRMMVRPIDPMATPGVDSVERQGTTSHAGSAEWPGADSATAADGTTAIEGTRPTLLSVSAALSAAGPDDGVSRVPVRDSYSHRLLATRRLYDGGAVVDGSPALAALVSPTDARVNPHDLDQLGVMSGDPVRVRAAQFSSLVTARSDVDIPRGVVDLGFNVPFSEKGGRAVSDDDTATVADLIDVTAMVTDVRLETP